MSTTKTQPFTLTPLPYAGNALDPCISASTIDFHYGKHHQAYVRKLNELVSGTEFSELKLEEIIVKTAGVKSQSEIFNNAAQVWNHSFYWNSLTPKGGNRPTGELGQKIESRFGSYDSFIKEFADKGTQQFGSGWLWLVKENGVLKIIKTANAENPLSQKRGRALLGIDVWEHAYYLDFQNRRNDYLSVILDKLLNWDFAVENFNQS